MTDDLLWLGFVAATYIRETGDLSILDDEAPFLDAGTRAALPTTSCARSGASSSARARAGSRYIGAGDWNDGLSAMGLEERGESFWLGQFLAGLLAEWSRVWIAIRPRRPLAQSSPAAASELVAAINAPRLGRRLVPARHAGRRAHPRHLGRTGSAGSS